MINIKKIKITNAGEDEWKSESFYTSDENSLVNTKSVLEMIKYKSHTVYDVVCACGICVYVCVWCV